MNTNLSNMLLRMAIRPGAIPGRFCQSRPNTWRALSASVLALLLLLGSISLLGLFADQIDQQLLRLVMISLALLPAMVWNLSLILGRGPENSPLVLVVFVIGFLLAAAVTRPLLQQVFEYESWMSATSANNRFIASIAVGGLLHSFAIYAIVRYTVWGTPAFETRSDGVLYTLSAAFGYASAQSLFDVLSYSQVVIENAGPWIIAHQAPYLVSAIVLGYFLGRNAFEDAPIYFLTAGLGAAALLCGLLQFAIPSLNTTSLGFESDNYGPWPGAIVTLLFLAAASAAVFGVIQRMNSLTLARLQEEAE